MLVRYGSDSVNLESPQHERKLRRSDPTLLSYRRELTPIATLQSWWGGIIACVPFQCLHH